MCFIRLKSDHGSMQSMSKTRGLRILLREVRRHCHFEDCPERLGDPEERPMGNIVQRASHAPAYDIPHMVQDVCMHAYALERLNSLAFEDTTNLASIYSNVALSCIGCDDGAWSGAPDLNSESRVWPTIQLMTQQTRSIFN